VRGLDCFPSRKRAQEYLIDAAAILVLVHTHTTRGIGLGVGINKQNLLLCRRNTRGKVDGGGRLSDPTLLVRYGDDLSQGVRVKRRETKGTTRKDTSFAPSMQSGSEANRPTSWK
jgi:hypothetical protein